MSVTVDDIAVVMAVFACAIEYAYGNSNERTCDRYYTPSSVLLKPNESPAAVLLNGNDDKSYIVHLGLNVSAFNDLYGVFSSHYPRKATTGRPRAFTCKMVLALVLMWLHNTMKQESLCLIFGATASTISKSLNSGLNILHFIFMNHPLDERWKIMWPTPEEMMVFNDMILTNTTNENEQEVMTGAFGFIDGLNLKIEDPGDPDEQNAYYNGWLSGCFCSQVIVFTPDGCICYVKYVIYV